MEPSKTIVLDRDGVINQDSSEYIKSHEEWIPVPGSIEAIAALHAANYKILVATNQSGLARGLFTEYDLAKMHHKLCSMVEEAGGFITGIFYCPHNPEEDCDCRKPKTGLLVQAEIELALSLRGSIFVGDSDKDLLAAQSHGMRPILVRTGKGKLTESNLDKMSMSDTEVFDDLSNAVISILSKVS